MPVPSSDWLAKATTPRAVPAVGRFPRPEIAAHLLSRSPGSHVKHLVPLQLQSGRKLATIPATPGTTPASSIKITLPTAGCTEKADYAQYAACNCRKSMIAGFSFHLSSDSGAFTCVPTLLIHASSHEQGGQS